MKSSEHLGLSEQRTLSDHLRAVCIVESPLPAVDEALTRFLAKFGETKKTQLSGCSAVAAYLSPLLSFGTRHVLLPHGDWTVIIDNMHRGSPGDLGVPLSTRVGAVVVNATWRDDGRFWEVLHRGETQRAVACYEDGDRWVFHQEGAPKSFEDESLYSRRKKNERFPVSAVQGYVQAMTGLAFPIDWRSFLSAAVGIERSIAQFKAPITEFPVANDICPI